MEFTDIKSIINSKLEYIGIACIFLLGIAGAWVFKFIYFPLLLLAAIGVIYYFIKSISSPFLMLVLISLSTFLGGVFKVFGQEAVIPITLFQLFFAIGLITYLIHIVDRGDFDFKMTGLEIPTLVFLGIIFLSIFFTPERFEALIQAIRFIALLIYILYALNVVEKKSHYIIIFSLATLIMLGLGAYSTVQIVLNPEVLAMNVADPMSSTAGRAAVGEFDPNFFATKFFIPIAFTAALVHSPKISKYIRIAAGIALGILLVGVISTYSRSAWLAVIAIILTTVYGLKNYKIFGTFLFLGVVTILIVPALRESMFNFVSRFMNIFTGGMNASSQIRILLAFGAMQMAADTYLLGVGFMGFPSHIYDYYSVYEIVYTNQPHNITYRVLSELGIIGLVVFIYIMYWIIIAAYNNYRYSRNHIERVISVTLFSSLLGYLIFHQFIPQFYGNNILMLNIGLIFSFKYMISE